MMPRMFLLTEIWLAKPQHLSLDRVGLLEGIRPLKDLHHLLLLLGIELIELGLNLDRVYFQINSF